MKRKMLLMLLLAPLTTSVWAQRYFSKTDRLHALSSRIAGVQVQGATLYTVGSSWDSSNLAAGGAAAYPNYGISLTGWDAETGIRKSQRSIEKGYPASPLAEARALELQGADCFKALPGGGYAIAIRTTDAQGIIRIGLVVANADGSQRFMKEYDVPAGSAGNGVTVRSLAPTGNGEWLVLAGYTDAAHPAEQDLLLLKIDAQFNLLWAKQYGDPGYSEQPGRILVEEDGYTLAGGFTNEFSTADPAAMTHQAQLFKVNTDGAVQWSWLSDPALHIAAVTDVLRTPDGGYLYCGLGDGVLQATADGEIDYSFRGWVEKLDASRTPQWHLNHVDAFSRSRSNGHNRLLQLPEGDYMVAGSRCELTEEGRADFKGSLMLFTKEGMVQWQRSYNAGSGSGPAGTLADLSLLSDGSIALGGWVEEVSDVPGLPLQQAWLLKVDRNGCMGSGDPQCPPPGVAPRINGREARGARYGALPVRSVPTGIFRQARQ